MASADKRLGSRDGIRAGDERAKHSDSARAAVARIRCAPSGALSRSGRRRAAVGGQSRMPGTLCRTRPHMGGWTYPYNSDPPHPHPVTSIGWRLVHLIADNEIYMEHAFGPGLRNFPDLPVHGTATEVLADWENSREPVTAWLASAPDKDLLEPPSEPSRRQADRRRSHDHPAGRADTPRR